MSTYEPLETRKKQNELLFQEDALMCLLQCKRLFTPSNFTIAARLFATSEGTLYRFYGGFFRTDVPSSQYNRMEALFVLALVTGMRRGEIIGLKWSDVNFTEGVISIQRSLVELKGGIIESKPKSTRGYRSILLPPFALEALKKHRERQERMRQGALKWQENDYVFCTSHGTQLQQRTCVQRLKRC